ncbi:MAG TPA: TonB-dependent receptor, partial [Thermoanaerobaculia bacterium]|nr:TonB-dependent receptor [Thermoanaerobaculia bacterium]
MIRTLGAAVCVLLLAAAASAQSTDTASIRGSVTDAAGARVAGATVTLENLSSGTRRTTASDSKGDFAFGAIPVAGTYRLRVAKEGFAETAQGPFSLRTNETATFQVKVAPEAVSEAVTVYGTTEHVRSDSPELGTRLNDAAIRTVPIVGRKLTSLPLLNSAVRPARGTGDLFLNNTLFVINGGGRRQTTIALDGASADDAWGRQTIFTNVPVSAVQDFTVLTNAFSAEYGRTTGSAINVVTKMGTNDFLGDAVVLDRPAGPEASAPVTNLSTKDVLKQGSLTLSGPIVKDRIHILGSLEYNNQNRDSVITSALAPGVYTGDFHQTLGLVRLDDELAPANHLMLRGNIDRFTDDNPADVVGGITLPSAGRTFRRATNAIALNDTAVLSSSLFNEARVIREAGSPITEFTPLTPSTQFVRPGVSTEGESRSASLFNRQYQLADTVSSTFGNHSLRFGGDFLRSRSGGNGQEFGAPFALGQFTFKTGIPASTPTAALTINDVARYTEGFGNATYKVTDRLWSVFVQDDWRPIQALTVNLGVRYDRQQLTDDTNNIAPRLGFAYNLGDDGRTVLRGGYGVFYSQVQSNIVATWALGGPTGFFNFSVAPGQLGFPTSLTPVTSFPAGANLPARDVTIRPGDAAYYSQFFDVSKLRFYPGKFLNPQTREATLGFEREIARQWFVSADAVYTHTTDIPWNLDANAPSLFVRTAPGQTRSANAADATRPITPVANGFRRILVTTNLGESKYRGVQINLRKSFEDRAGVMLSYTRSHATNNLEADAPGGDPNDVNLPQSEWADSLLDQRNRAVLTVWHRVPFDIVVGGVATAASGRPFNITTGADNNGDAASTDRPVINGQVIARNAGRGTSIFDADAFIEKDFMVQRGVQLAVRAEAFNLT